MTYNSIRQVSYSASIMFHLLLLLLFMLIKITIDYPVKEYVELSFGKTGQVGSTGAIGTKINQVEELAQPQKVTKTKDNKREVKEVALPKAKNTSENNPAITPADKNKEKSNVVKNETNETKNSNVTTEGQGNKAAGEGSFGYDIDWGGQGTRKIYMYSVPAYPEGVEKEIDIRLRFSIKPDGTVGTVIPLTKADTRLENAAIYSLRQWRFEPLSPLQKQADQTAVIVFPYRLQ